MENRISLTAGQTIDAWRAVDLDGTLPGPGGGEVPASDLAGLLPVELALHGWDFAQTCGVQLDISDEVVAYLRTLAEGIDPGRPGERELQGRGHSTRGGICHRPARGVRGAYADARLTPARHHRWSSSDLGRAASEASGQTKPGRTPPRA